MKNLNNRGFLLVETVIVSVFVLTMFVLVYQNSLPMIDEYNQRIRYDDMDTVYNASIFRKLIMNDANYKNFLDAVGAENGSGYLRLDDCAAFSEEQKELCKKFVKLLGVEEDNRIYLTKWEITGLNALENLPRGFLEYAKYLHNQEQEKVTDYRLLFSRNITYKLFQYDEKTGLKKEITKKEGRYANIGM